MPMDRNLLRYLVRKLREQDEAADEYLEVLFGVAYDAGVLDAKAPGLARRRDRSRASPPARTPWSSMGEKFFSLGMEFLKKHIGRIDGLLAQWVEAGRSLNELAYRHLPDKNLEQLWHNDSGLSLVDVRRTNKAIPGVGIQSFTEYKIYPNGRPGDFPELAFEGAQSQLGGINKAAP